MTRSDKLDTILNGLLYIDKRLLSNEPVGKKITMEFLCETLNLDCEKWEMVSLKNELIEEGHIIEINEELRITEPGKKFNTRQKGYRQLDKKQKEENTIREKSIEKFKYDKYSFWISILAIFVSALSLFLSFRKP
jgi:hypothetical protein